MTTRNKALRLGILTALFAALTAILAQIQLPIGPVPFNLAVLGAFLAGMLLPPVWALGSMGLYMLLGIVGVPVFAGFVGGPAILFGKTGGYVLGYCCIALCTALAARSANRVLTLLGMVLGLVLCYVLGTAWFMAVTGSNLISSLAWCVLPFILPDLGKAACGYALGRVLANRLARAGLHTEG